MLPDAFHPATRAWFAERFGQPTPAQSAGWAEIVQGHSTLIAAPTGSGKTLAAFLAAVDGLFRRALAGTLADATYVLYISPLKALTRDIHENLHAPLHGIGAGMGFAPDTLPVRAAVRTGDTTTAERRAMVKKAPHVLATTPESFYLLLTSDSGRRMLQGVTTVIVDEIHAVAGNRRGSHLSLSLERLATLTAAPLQRIGLSATQKPLADIAHFLIGGPDAGPCRIVDAGLRRVFDLALEVPRSPLEAVMSSEVWQETYDRLTELVATHRTTLVFVNTRRMAERVAQHLGERLGQANVASHHGSLSASLRHKAEQRLKAGELKVLVATASLELGIDIGNVDLACQLGSVRAIGAFLQRMGRSRHMCGGIPKGRLFPLTRDELLECTALVQSVRLGELDVTCVPHQPLDILAQQIVAACACETWDETALFDCIRRAYPYRDLPRHAFDAVVRMLAEGFATRRGRRAALLHHDAVNGRLSARRGARLLALTSGGAIAENADFTVVLEPSGHPIGTLNEDFVIDSSPGDIFQLGNASWRFLGVQAGTVRVEDAQGQPPTVPFWFGEAPARSDALSAAVSRLCAELEPMLGDRTRTVAHLCDDAALPREAMEQLVDYLAAIRASLGVLPRHDVLVAERFFDEGGGMQLVLHTRLGGRINRAWGLALRKCFCRTFNFELQAAATEDAIVLSLGEQHSFPLADVFRFLKPETVRHTLIQALLDAPMFNLRWRWNASRALALTRWRNGRKVPPQLLRMAAEDLVAAVFPDQLACLENIVGERQIPDHPLVQQTIDDCLQEAMDLGGLIAVLEAMPQHRLVAIDTPEPSPACHEVLNARPYAFLDDAPLEERRARAVQLRRTLDVQASRDDGALDSAAIEAVQEQAWPAARDADEMHDILLCLGVLPEAEAHPEAAWEGYLASLVAQRRAALWTLTPKMRAWVAAERVTMVQAAYPAGDGVLAPAPGSTRWDTDVAVRELVRNRLQAVGPTTETELANALALAPRAIETALLALEADGFVLRGQFRAAVVAREWCERRLLARIHRLTITRLRRDIAPVTLAEYCRFLASWQHVTPDQRLVGGAGLAAVIQQLDGFELPARAWEADVLRARLHDYAPSMLDALCQRGEVGWGRLSGTATHGNPGDLQGGMRSLASSPLTLFCRDTAWAWLALRAEATPTTLTDSARLVLTFMHARGASFFAEIARGTALSATGVETALAELAATGWLTSDSFMGLRALLVPAAKRAPAGVRRHPRLYTASIERAGRWSLLAGQDAPGDPDSLQEAVVQQARALLRRYGVVCRRLCTRETNAAPWRLLVQCLRTLEARGEVRGGYFVAGVGGEQFALPEAVGLLRQLRQAPPPGDLVLLSAADPLNLVGILTPGERVVAIAKNRLLCRDGVPVLAIEAGKSRPLDPSVANPQALLDQLPAAPGHRLGR